MTTSTHTRPAIKEGARAGFFGRAATSNPYTDPEQRAQWQRGWEWARAEVAAFNAAKVA